nr:hypothetical protein I308_06664 [Cryptococcus tetragattii IND107]
MKAMNEHSSDDIQRPDTGAHCVRGLFDYRYDSAASFFAFFSCNLLYSSDNFTDCRFHFQCFYKKTRRQIKQTSDVKSVLCNLATYNAGCSGQR